MDAKEHHVLGKGFWERREGYEDIMDAMSTIWIASSEELGKPAVYNTDRRTVSPCFLSLRIVPMALTAS